MGKTKKKVKGSKGNEIGDYSIVDGIKTFTLDPWKGKSIEELKDDLDRFSRALGQYEMIILDLVENKGVVEYLSPMFRKKVENLIEAYKD